MSITVTGPGGMTVDFPDGTPSDVIDSVMRRQMAPGEPGLAADIGKSLGTGAVKGGLGLVGIPDFLDSAVGAGADWLIGKGLLPQPAGTPQQQAAALQGRFDLFPSAAGMQAGIEKLTGAFHEPETRAGRYAERTGEFAVGALGPGGPLRRLAQTVVPAFTSERLGEATKGTSYEAPARIVGALAGGLGASGVEAAIGRARSGVHGVQNPAAGRSLRATLTPGAEARAAELGPEAMLLDTTIPARTLAQGIAVRPGPAQETIVGAVTGRNRTANARLTGELDATLGPAVSPARIEESLQQQRASLSPLYEQVTNLNNPVNLRPVYDQLRADIAAQSGPARAALQRVLDDIAPMGPAVPGGRAQRIPRTHPREVLNARHAVDDLLAKIEETPNAHGAVQRYRRLIDEALADAVPDIKVLDATFENLSRTSEALRGGTTVLRTGPEAIRPEDLIAQRAAMTGPQRAAQRYGARADLDRIVGTKANDVVALKQTVMSEGDWNPVKLAEVFGGREANRIMRAVDREAAFQDAYKKIVENSQTAQRVVGEKAVPSGKVQQSDLKGVTLTGMALSGAQKAVNAVRNAVRGGSAAAADDELARLLTAKGQARDELMRQIRAAQQRQQRHSTPTRELILRAAVNANAALLPLR